MIVLAFLAALCTVKVADGLHGGPGVVAAIVAVFLVQLPYILPRAEPFRARHWVMFLAAQAVLTYLPFVIFGSHWVAGVSGLLGGSLLLALPGQVSWLAFGAVVVAETALGIGVLHFTGPADICYLITATAANGLSLYGLVRLAWLLHDHSNRLSIGLSDGLSGELPDRLSAGLSDRPSGEPLDQPSTGLLDQPSGGLSDRLSGGLSDGPSDGPSGGPSDGLSGGLSDGLSSGSGQGRAAAHMARMVIVALCSCYAVQTVLEIRAYSHVGGLVLTAGAAVTTAVVLLQLHHSMPRSGNPEAWPLTISLQAVLMLALATIAGWPAYTMAGLVLGSTLLLVRAPWPVIPSGLILVGSALAFPPPAPIHPGNHAYLTAAVVTVGLAAYGLSRFAELTVRPNA